HICPHGAAKNAGGERQERQVFIFLSKKIAAYSALLASLALSGASTTPQIWGPGGSGWWIVCAPVGSLDLHTRGCDGWALGLIEGSCRMRDSRWGRAVTSSCTALP